MNLVVFVARTFDSQHIGKARFPLIKDVVYEVLSCIDFEVEPTRTTRHSSPPQQASPTPPESEDSDLD